MTAVFGGGAAGRLLGDEAGMHMVLEPTSPPRRSLRPPERRPVATLDRYFGGR
jgi:hypothetical protein